MKLTPLVIKSLLLHASTLYLTVKTHEFIHQYTFEINILLYINLYKQSTKSLFI